jgi:phosphate starvation-inducible PhoH-like protein
LPLTVESTPFSAIIKLRHSFEEATRTLETTRHSQVVVLDPEDNKHLLNLCGQYDEHIRLIEDHLEVDIKQRGFTFSVSGQPHSVKNACLTLKNLYQQAQKEDFLAPYQVHLYLQTIGKKGISSSTNLQEKSMDIRIRRGAITARGNNQVKYIQNILEHDINFGIGPAGTGKTYLAVACAVNALETQRVSRIVLVRPIVEAGEKLGFLPGDLAQKVNPFLRPLYDALYDMLGPETVTQLMERNIIELAPLAYMRGRTLNDSFIILDEGQNTTTEQMKMFLTRIGFNSKSVITGDITQIDLQNRRDSGLIHTMDVLQGVKGISFTQFQASDVVRHPLVQSIVEAYERHDEQKQQGK